MVPLSPLATDSSFSLSLLLELLSFSLSFSLSLFFLLLRFLFRQPRRNGAHRERFLFRDRLQDLGEALADRGPIVAGGGFGGSFFVTAPQLGITQQHDHRLGK